METSIQYAVFSVPVIVSKNRRFSHGGLILYAHIAIFHEIVHDVNERTLYFINLMFWCFDSCRW